VAGSVRSAEWRFFAVLIQAKCAARRRLVALVVLPACPAAFDGHHGLLVAAVQNGDPLAGPLAAMGVVFVLLQALGRCTTPCRPTRPRRRRRG